MSTPVQPIVMRLLREQAVTISRFGSEVRLQCDGVDDADALFSWLESQTGNAVEFIGRQSGDCECFCWDDVPSEQRDAINDDPWHEVPGRLYPLDVLRRLGVDDGMFRFTVSADRVDA